MINARTQAEIQEAKNDGVKFGQKTSSKNKNTADKIERIGIFLCAGNKLRLDYKRIICKQKDNC
jgi:DNA invertase Pin-like site-specific DNA recombinase